MATDEERTTTTAALVGAVGGAGTTRLAVEVGAVLARDGRQVGLFDAAFGSQGMIEYVDGRVGTDVTDLVTDPDVDPDAAMTRHDTGGSGALFLYPARAPFADIARANTTEAAQRLETVVADAGQAFDHVLLDVPPVASNPGVAAVTTAERVAVVAPPTDRGVDAVQRMRGRLVDVGASANLAVANRGADPGFEDAVAVPESNHTAPAGAPVSDSGTGQFSAAIGRVAERLLETDLDVEFESDGLVDRLRGN